MDELTTRSAEQLHPEQHHLCASQTNPTEISYPRIQAK
ncbi:hypothetical protein M2275_008493, partial [Rhodococcus opacus]|nr:hypothetical protein [Rhodococcus opacus]